MVKVHYTVKRENVKCGMLWEHTMKFETVKDAMRFVNSDKSGGKKGFILVGRPTLEHVQVHTLVRMLVTRQVIMLVTTKYDVGHTFCVPRVRKQVKQQELNWEGETWYKDIETYVPSVAFKKIVHIDIKVGRQVGIIYGVKDMTDQVDFISHYWPEANINNYTEEEAMSIAEEYAEQGKEYIGN